ncbi:phosphotransferase enzyme family protein [Aspergillus pseudoustus]|uniref:Phosphotransferase enzyme family protein n=1 Tax=Aspergillus pseudoustus TaxID=1810923 RepID=A0ABR4KFV3_9EURO
MKWDHLAERQSQEHISTWLEYLLQQMPFLAMQLANQHRPGHTATVASELTAGSCDIFSFVTFEDGTSVVVRFAILGRTIFRVEKTCNEVSVIRYLARLTIVPVSLVLGAGAWGCGPYIVTQYIPATPLSYHIESSFAVNALTRELRRGYHCMARIILELSKQTFPRIGALSQDIEGKWTIFKRPLTHNINDLVRRGNVPTCVFPDKTFATASEYFIELATEHLNHLWYQRNSAIMDATDCKRKYIARCLFRRIARIIDMEPGPFRLYCDNLHPSKVLVSARGNADFSVAAVTDWGYSYVAPNEFTYAAPWWLLLEPPEKWGANLTQFVPRYIPYLNIFLRILSACEDNDIQKGTLEASQRLSDRMANSFHNGLFWFCLAARNASMFDQIYWTFLDTRYFGPLQSLDDRLCRLSVEELGELDRFVALKMKHANEKCLDEHMSFDDYVRL